MIIKKEFNRDNLIFNGINLDPGVKDENGKVIKRGINSYNFRLIGWILELFHFAVSVKNGKETHYWNCKSVENCFNRIDSEKFPRNKIESHNKAWIQKALKDLEQNRENNVHEEQNKPADQQLPNQNEQPQEKIDEPEGKKLNGHANNLNDEAQKKEPHNMGLNVKDNLPTQPKAKEQPAIIPLKKAEAVIVADKPKQKDKPAPQKAYHLPDLFDLKLDKNHPITKSEFLVYPDHRQNKKIPKGMSDAVFKYAINIVRLFACFDEDSDEIGSYSPIKDENIPNHLKLADEINKACKQRLKQFDHVQLVERVNMLKECDPDFLAKIKICDLEESWEDSGLKVALMTPEEIKNITLEKYLTFNTRQRELFEGRAIKLLGDVKFDEKNWDKKNLKLITFSQFRSLTSKVVNEILPEISAEWLSWLTPEQFKGLKVANFTADQFESFFKVIPYPVNEGEDEEQYYNRVKANKITQDRIESLEKDQVMDLWPRLDTSRLRLLSGSQIEKIDFTQLLPLTREQADTLFPPYSNDFNLSSIQKLSMPQLYAVLHILTPYQMFMLSEKQIRALDFKHPSVTQAHINGLFFCKDLDHPEAYKRGDFYEKQKRGRENFSYLNKNQVELLWSLGLLDKDRYSLITPKQFEELDFINKCKPSMEIAKKLFPVYSPADAKLSFIQKLYPMEKLYAWLPYLEPSQLFMLSEQQIQEFDFNKYPLTQPQVKGLFYYQESDHPDQNKGMDHYLKQQRGQDNFFDLNKKNKGQVESLWSLGLLDKDRLNLITLKQFEELDFINKCKPSKEIAKELFPVYSPVNAKLSFIQKLYPMEKLYAWLPYLEPSQLFMLSEQQIQEFDFNKYPLTQPQVKGLFYYQESDHPDQNKGMDHYLKQQRGRDNFSYLNKNNKGQLESLSHLLDKHRLGMVTEEQIKKIDFENDFEVSQEIAEALFPIYNVRDFHRSLIQQLTVKNLYVWIPFLKPSQLIMLSEQQIRGFDFTKQYVSEEQINGLFFTQASDHPGMNYANFYEMREAGIKNLSYLSKTQIKSLGDDLNAKKEYIK